MPTNKKRQNKSDSNNDSSKKLKQQPIASFFARTTIKKAEQDVICESNNAKVANLEQNEQLKTFDLVKMNEDKDLIVEQKDEFFETSVYTDEFSTILDVVLEGEKYLFDQAELLLFDTYKALHGTCL
jgi:cupin superfamily acireductone dioxygenase involved in methionine salvage